MESIRQKGQRGISGHEALTLLEMLIAMAIMAVVMAAILPQFRNIQNSWSSKQGASEALQNGRVLIDHLNRNLGSAVLITAVSDPDVTNGFIEYEANDAITYRYEVSAGGYVQFGAVGSLSELAGPVDLLQFTCYDAYDLDTAITDTASIRCVEVAAVLVNPAENGQDKTFSTKAYLRTNGANNDVLAGTPYEYDPKKGKTPVLLKVAGNRFLCVYTGDHDRGSATILEVDADTWLISQGVSVIYDAAKGKDPAVMWFEEGSDEDMARFLVVYQGDGDDGTAVILNVDLNTWDISMETPFEYDTEKGKHPALVQIDDTSYLCAYNGKDDDGWAVVLTVDEDTFEITKGTPFEFDTVKGKTPVLMHLGTGQLDYLCVYTGNGDDGWAVVLTVDNQTLEITKGTPYEFDIFKGKTPALKRLNNWNYLCAYSGGPNKDHGWAVVLNVGNQQTITKGTPFEFDAKKGKTPVLAALDFLPPGLQKTYDFLCCYSGDKDHGRAIILRVDKSTWEVTQGNPLDYDDSDNEEEEVFEFEDDKARTPALCEIDGAIILCGYAGGPKKDHGWVVVFDVDNPIMP